MTLYAVAAGSTIQTADLNQYYNLLTGAMTDQPVVFAGPTFNVGGDGTTTTNNLTRLNAFVGSAANGVAGGFLNFTSNGPSGTDGTYIEYVPPASGANTAARVHISAAAAGRLAELDLAADVVYCGLDVTVQRNLTSASGQLQAATAVFAGNGLYQCIEAVNTNRNHVESSGPSGSVLVGSGSGTSVTFNFARAFATTPIALTQCTNTGAAPYKTTDLAALSTTSVSMSYWNHDPNPQTLSNFMIMAYGD